MMTGNIDATRIWIYVLCARLIDVLCARLIDDWEVETLRWTGLMKSVNIEDSEGIGHGRRENRKA